MRRTATPSVVLVGQGIGCGDERARLDARR